MKYYSLLSWRNILRLTYRKWRLRDYIVRPYRTGKLSPSGSTYQPPWPPPPASPLCSSIVNNFLAAHPSAQLLCFGIEYYGLDPPHMCIASQMYVSRDVRHCITRQPIAYCMESYRMQPPSRCFGPSSHTQLGDTSPSHQANAKRPPCTDSAGEPGPGHHLQPSESSLIRYGQEVYARGQ